MVFTSFVFLFVFLPALLLVYHVLPRPLRNPCLLLFSYVFYGWWRVDFTLLLLTSTLVDYVCGRVIGGSDNQRVRRAWLAVSVVFNLGLLGYFKYYNFGIESLNVALAGLGFEQLEWTAVVLPVGISFFTFQTMSYTIDVYRGDVQATKSVIGFATFVSMFPQLVAGPIVRYRDIEQALAAQTRSLDQISRGVSMFLIGFNKKVLLANNFGIAADEVFNRPDGILSAWLGLVAYTFQIYFDFSGYSDMAVGLGRMLGFEFPRNFDGPYKSRSITEFWRRWHMTLSTWIRDYLYVSLGGNRGTVSRTYFNLVVSMLLCGVWHGAAWTFVAWGAFHGALLVVERINGRKPLYAALPAWGQVAATWLLVMLGWMIFRSDSMAGVAEYAVALVDFSGPVLAADAYWVRQPVFFVLLAIGFGVVFKGIDAFALADKRSLAWDLLQLGVFVFAVAELLSQEFNPFLYFQF